MKVTGRTAQHGTGDSGPRGHPPPHAQHTSRPPECNVTERQGGTPPPRLFREWGSPAFGVQTGRGSGLPVPKPLRPEPEIGGPMQQPPAHAVMCNRSRVLGGPPELRITRVRPEPFSPPPKVSLPGFPGQQVSPTRAAPAPTCVRRGLHAGGPGARRPDSGPQLPAPALPRPVLSRVGRAALAVSPGLASQSLSPPRRRLPG